MPVTLTQVRSCCSTTMLTLLQLDGIETLLDIVKQVVKTGQAVKGGEEMDVDE